MINDIQMMNGEEPWVLSIFFFLMGACIGSFLNVCIYRIPAGLSVIRPASRCGVCKTPIPVYYNIPIISWFILRGKCFKCGAKFSIRYSIIELVTALLFLFIWWKEPNLTGISYMLMASLLIAASMIDLDHMFIPDRFSVGLAVIGFLIAVFYPPLFGYIDPEMPSFLAMTKSGIQSLVGIMIPSAFLLWIGILCEVVLKREALGFGDIKLIGGIGAFIGWQGGLFALFGGAIIGCIFMLPYLLYKRITEKENAPPPPNDDPNILFSESAFISDEEDESEHIPFGPMLSLGAIAYVLGAKDFLLEFLRQIERL